MLVDTQKQTCQNPTEWEVFCVGLPSPPLPPPKTATSHGGLRNFGYLANTEYPPPKKNQNLTFFALVHFLTSPRIPLLTPHPTLLMDVVDWCVETINVCSEHTVQVKLSMTDSLSHITRVETNKPVHCPVVVVSAVGVVCPSGHS